MAETAEIKTDQPPPLLGNKPEGGFNSNRGRGGRGGRGSFRGNLMGEHRGGRHEGGESRNRDFRDHGNENRNMGGGDRNRGMGNDRGRERRGGYRGGRGGMGSMRAMEDRLLERIASISGPTYDLPIAEDQAEPKKFTNRSRLFVGNITEGTSLEEFQEMFKEFGECIEPYVNTDKAFGFVKLDYRENAEKARRALDGTMRNGRTLKVRFSAMGCTLKIKRLSPWVTNELLELAFGVFGELERCNIIVDERGKSTGEGIIEYSKKPCAMQCLQKCTESSFFLTESLCPVEVEIMKEDDLEEGLPEKALPRKHPEFMRERSVGPRMGMPGSFEHEFGLRWKQLYELEKERREQLRTEMRLEAEKLQDQMEYARREHETEMLREQLRQRELEQQRSKSDWEQRQMQRDQERRRYDEMVQRRQEQMQDRMRQSEDDMKRRSTENRLFVQANELNSLLDQQEQAIWGSEPGGGVPPVTGAPPPVAGQEVYPSYGALAAGSAPWGQPPPSYETGGASYVPAWNNHAQTPPPIVDQDNMNGNGANMDRAGQMGGDQGNARSASPGQFRGGRGGYRGGRAPRDQDGGDYAKRQRMF